MEARQKQEKSKKKKEKKGAPGPRARAFPGTPTKHLALREHRAASLRRPGRGRGGPFASLSAPGRAARPRRAQTARRKRRSPPLAPPRPAALKPRYCQCGNQNGKGNTTGGSIGPPQPQGPRVPQVPPPAGGGERRAAHLLSVEGRTPPCQEAKPVANATVTACVCGCRTTPSAARKISARPTPTTPRSARYARASMSAPRKASGKTASAW